MLRTLHLDKAQRLMQEGLRLEPNHPKCLYIAALIHIIQGRSSATENEHLQRLLTEYPERLQSLMTLVVALNQRGDNRSALRVAQQLLTLRPDSPAVPEPGEGTEDADPLESAAALSDATLGLGWRCRGHRRWASAWSMLRKAR